MMADFFYIFLFCIIMNIPEPTLSNYFHLKDSDKKTQYPHPHHPAAPKNSYAY